MRFLIVNNSLVDLIIISSSSFFQHLISWCKKNNPAQLPLYHVPPHFGYDLLNGFLQKYTQEESDYYFCYWGPKGSNTALHMDVLNSFSWSYNVCGVKEWTFYPPPPPNTEPPAPSSFVVRQEAGECVFVPAGWRHTVTNLEETLSINHNWITTSNIDLVWDCIVSEMHQVGKELRKWDDGDNISSSSDMEAHESMLRGCAGLDVTAYYFMIVHGIIEALKSRPSAVADTTGLTTTIFDLVRLGDMLETLLDDDELGLLERLAASLQDGNFAQKAVKLGTGLLEFLERDR